MKEGLVSLEEDLLKLTDKLQQEAQRIPNMSHPDVPVGGEDCFVLRKMVMLHPSPYRSLLPKMSVFLWIYFPFYLYI